MTPQRFTASNVSAVLGIWISSLTAVVAQQTLPSTLLLSSQREALLKPSASSGSLLQLQTSEDLVRWEPWITYVHALNSQQTDSLAPYLPLRFYRAQDGLPAGTMTGDHFATDAGPLVIRPVDHAGFVIQWNGKMIHNDPVETGSLYAALPKADLILVSHGHPDHFSASTIQSVKGPGCIIVAPASVQSGMAAALKAITIPLSYGASTNVLGGSVEAVAAHNSNHPFGAGNGYVLTVGDKRIYMSGDTGNVPEMRALRDIDIAFVCMNLPFTMDVTNAATAVRAFKPRVVYPYHYRNRGGTLADLGNFKHQVGTDLGIEVRIRKWY